MRLAAEARVDGNKPFMLLPVARVEFRQVLQVNSLRLSLAESPG